VKLREGPAVVCVRATLKEGAFSIGTVRICENVPLDLTGGSLWPDIRYHP
jgi:hypothetical protein